ncbi:fanconi anemia group J protein [Nematocida minor]|uniref:fanconi anemia group J protein n=1 Tax=Nematocida minor TaxID=1912983 RepID=UPI002220CD7C|nr:fanconi anemia group J protein [Nematocida minor]KAI5191702.1 fanconi anemia group J protein [Nematocida minor]
MHTINIEGHSVRSPHELYEPQKQSVETILKCLVSGESGMIESPTGTGKTLSILAAVIAWIGAKSPADQKGIKVFITTRTIKQAYQLIDHMKRMENPPSMSLLASRKHLCLNPDVKKSKDIDTACKNKVKSENPQDKCRYYFNSQKDDKKKKDTMDNRVPKVFSIEDLLSTGKTCNACPYYYTREKQNNATIIFSPYNYIINPRIRKAMGITLDDAAVIVDEAHNIDDVCRSTGSVEIDTPLVEIIDKIVTLSLSRPLHSPELEEALRVVKMFLTKILNYISEIPSRINKEGLEAVVSQTGEKEAAIPQNNIQNELKLLGISEETFKGLEMSIHTVLDELVLETFIEQWLHQILSVFNYMMQPSQKEKYGMVITKNKISFLLLHASVVFNEIYEKARCVVLLSGTLYPFKELARELVSSNPLKAFVHFMQAGHIIPREQLSTSVVSSYHGTEILGTYAGTQQNKYYRTIADVIVDVAHNLDRIGGVLCFVPSYAAINKLTPLLNRSVCLIVESKSSDEFEGALQEYRSRCRRGKCVFLCVFRGKASEGIDFRDHESRAVVLVGIPYQSVRDHSIILKKKYNNQYLGNTGSEWYNLQAYKAVNQAMGRCIRHLNDWGSIFLVDTRYAKSISPRSNTLSQWAVEKCSIIKSKEDMMKTFLPFVERQKPHKTAPEEITENSSNQMKRKIVYFDKSSGVKRFFDR